ncbi:MULTISPECIES: DNA methyltransferase [unclassified Rubrivivax]|uniref:DNA methyltransferase n=1 Tax=unclassified Rubrivivax TaxID=2649762 RepID=UPI001E483FFD|nr:MULTISPECIES: DNA methyltransferase [unclassified Rubrivivax]MCC9596427.1 site-specific DNA-methyltransferase [Rubrivivax sp. JA1055]MCC9647229.1 site-specific DNA-methyltransferase [Rubrivivax sp. JA1029]
MPITDADRLQAIDWSFSVRGKASKVEAIHPYPAKFIGEIPAAFLSSLPIPANTAVLDPFCGSGTTLLEAQKFGRPSVGIDLNPIACLISRVKTSPLADGFLEAVRQLSEDAQAVKRPSIPDIPNIDHWFEEGIQKAVAALAVTVAKPCYEPWRDALRLALSSILVRVSNQDSDTRYAAVNKGIVPADVFAQFQLAAQKMSKALATRSWTLLSAKVIESDVLRVTPEKIGVPVGLMVTSPPYPNAYEYWLYHKYRMWWLGFDPIAVKEQEIGARAHFFKKHHHTAEMFVDQMRGTLELVNSVLVPGGYACVVVGRSRIHGKIHDNGAMIYDLGLSMGLEPIIKLEREINSSRKSFNLSHANIKTETVLVLKKR